MPKYLLELTAQNQEQIAKSIPPEVDLDTIINCLDVVSQQFSAIQSEYGKVKPWGIDAEDVKWFLTFFSEGEYLELNQEKIIPLNRVFSKPWNQWRLALALAHRQLGQNPPPIHVNAYRFEDNSYWYTINDGMHRTTAAKMAGEQTIKALIREERMMLTKRYALCDGHLFKLDDQGAVLMSKHLPRGYYNFLEGLFGVKRHPHNLLELIWEIIARIT